LDGSDAGSEDALAEEPGSKGAACVFPDEWQLSQRGPGFRAQLIELPADLVADCVDVVGSRQARCFGSVCGGAEGMDAHVGDARGLCCCSCGRDGRLGCDVVGGASCNETTSDLSRGIKLAACEGAGASDRIARPLVCGRLRLEHCEDSFGAVSGPRCHDPPIRLAQSLWRSHHA